MALSFYIPQALDDPICTLEIVTLDDSSFNNVTGCILHFNSDNFNKTRSSLFDTGNDVALHDVADISILVNPCARLTSTSDPYDNLVDASTCLNSTSTKVNVKISNIININKYSFLNKLLRKTCCVVKAKAKFFGKISKNKKEPVTEEMISGLYLSMTKKMWLQEVQKDLQRIKNFKNVSYQLDSFGVVVEC